MESRLGRIGERKEYLVRSRSGAVDGSLGWAPNEDRKKDLLYTRPVLSARMVFFQNRSHVVSWTQLAELSGMSGDDIKHARHEKFARMGRFDLLSPVG